MTSYERTGWRDQEISARHRAWGFNCPAVDLDFLMVEYNLGYPVAVVEYKSHHARLSNLKHPTYRALGELYDRDGKQLPLFIVRYWPTTWAFRVLALNDSAQQWLQPDTWVDMSEREFVTGLYRLRQLTIEHQVIARLYEERPPSEAVAS